MLAVDWPAYAASLDAKLACDEDPLLAHVASEAPRSRSKLSEAPRSFSSHRQEERRPGRPGGARASATGRYSAAGRYSRAGSAHLFELVLGDGSGAWQVGSLEIA